MNITPFKELNQGTESIYDHLGGVLPPSEVIEYLKTTKPYMMSPGVYQHPFRPEVRLLGPYVYSDGTFSWDRDTWKYVVKYGLKLPQEFMDHVMSPEGKAFVKKMKASQGSWQKTFCEWDKRDSMHLMVPENAGDISIDDF